MNDELKKSLNGLILQIEDIKDCISEGEEKNAMFYLGQLHTEVYIIMNLFKDEDEDAQ